MFRNKGKHQLIAPNRWQPTVMNSYVSIAIERLAFANQLFDVSTISSGKYKEKL
jgi:hypothetical protein